MHFPFQDLPSEVYAAAGVRLTTRERSAGAAEIYRTWPLAWVPQVRMTWPRVCLHPDDQLDLDGLGWSGTAFGDSGHGLLVEEFRGEVRRIDGTSSFWDARADELEDMGITTSVSHEVIEGREGLPTH